MLDAWWGGVTSGIGKKKRHIILVEIRNIFRKVNILSLPRGISHVNKLPSAGLVHRFRSRNGSNISINRACLEM